jgi:hypothetical protein
VTCGNGHGVAAHEDYIFVGAFQVPSAISSMKAQGLALLKVLFCKIGLSPE